jgi:hypothetical protein
MQCCQLFMETIVRYDSDDMWYDFGVEEAERYLAHFTQADWQSLQAALSALNDYQLQRAAYALSSGSFSEASELLIQIILQGGAETSLVACDALRALLEQNGSTITVPFAVYQFVGNLCESACEPWRTSCHKLITLILPSNLG